MICFPHAKINLGLSVISKRPDGFHNLETIFYPLPLYDILEVIPSAKTSFFPTGLEIAGIADDNIVLRAYHLLKDKYAQIGSLEIYLHKAIPMGAGLGGGSSDAAEIIQLLNRFFELKLSGAELTEYALKLGSDCPFFMLKKPCFANGRGEILEPLMLDLSDYSFLLIHPEIKINTTWAFSQIKPSPPLFDLRNSIGLPIQDWSKTIHNDFERIVFEAHPSLLKIKEKLYSAGALFASMTGSGSTIFGIFNKSSLPNIAFENSHQTYIH
jgi:4-diphosphocytidyl-2-C-methyl-D-erythritol kinase